LACFLYEGVLLFGVVMASAWLYSTLTQQRHALQGKFGLQAVLFFVLGAYFVAFWSRGGQTLAMKTWHIRLVAADGTAVRPMRAVARYLLAWLWFLPALLAIWIADLHGAWSIVAILLGSVLTYAALAWLHPRRQYWHDAVCGTALIDWRGVPAGQNRGP
jgi:uncharacterized RDD family membrane protein YckC